MGMKRKDRPAAIRGQAIRGQDSSKLKILILDIGRHAAKGEESLPVGTAPVLHNMATYSSSCNTIYISSRKISVLERTCLRTRKHVPRRPKPNITTALMPGMGSSLSTSLSRPKTLARVVGSHCTFFTIINPLRPHQGSNTIPTSVLPINSARRQESET